jgi:hypothetical protein
MSAEQATNASSCITPLKTPATGLRAHAAPHKTWTQPDFTWFGSFHISDPRLPSIDRMNTGRPEVVKQVKLSCPPNARSDDQALVRHKSKKLIEFTPFPHASSSCKGFFFSSCRWYDFLLTVAPENAEVRRFRTNKDRQLVAERLESLGCLAVDLGVLLGVGQLTLRQLLALVVGGTLGLAALLESREKRQSVRVLNRSPPISVVDTTERGTYLSTTSWYFQPTSWLRRPTVQYLRPGCSLRTRRAWGTTIFFCLS